MFNRGDFVVAKKTVLVPFSEYIPLPLFIRDWVNETFFGGQLQKKILEN